LAALLAVAVDVDVDETAGVVGAGLPLFFEDGGDLDGGPLAEFLVLA